MYFVHRQNNKKGDRFFTCCKYCRRRSEPNVQLFIIHNIVVVDYPTDSIMNNSVKIKLISFW